MQRKAERYPEELTDKMVSHSGRINAVIFVAWYVVLNERRTASATLRQFSLFPTYLFVTAS